MAASNGYRLRVPDETVKFLRRLHPELKKHIRYAFKAILDEPYCGKALKDDLDGLRSYKIKRYRVIYRVLEKPREIHIIAVGPRKNVYEDTFLIISKK